jgi:thiol-disulfide isomerase/thioredoxin
MKSPFVIFMAAAVAAAFGQKGVLEGHIRVYKTGKPLRGIELSFSEGGNGAAAQKIKDVSDAKGHFLLTGLPSSGLVGLHYDAGHGGVTMYFEVNNRDVQINVRDDSFHLVKAGEHMPAVTMKTWLNTKPLNKELKDKIVFLDFWAISCVPCRAALPAVEALSKKYDGKVVFIGIHSNDTDANHLREFAKKYGLTYPLAIDEGGDGGLFTDQFISQGIPTICIVGKDGRIVQINGTLEDAQKKLDEMLEAPQPR